MFVKVELLTGGAKNKSVSCKFVVLESVEIGTGRQLVYK